MNGNESKNNEIKNNNIKDESKEIIDNNDLNNQIIPDHNDDIIEILNKIFAKSKNDNNKFTPILLKSGEEEIIKIFTIKPNFKDELSFKEFILQKLKLISYINSIVSNSIEILHIISDYLSKKNISIIIYIIDLYITYITIYQNKEMNQIIINEIKRIFSFLISCGLLTKKDVDYIYQKIAFFQLEKKLTIKIFNDIIPLLEIIYGVNTDIDINKNMIVKKYIYFYDKNNSSIETNITERLSIQIKSGFCIILWFYLKDINDDNQNKGNLLYIKNDKGDKINLILNNKNDIDIIYNDNIYMKEKENKNFDIKTNIWTQIKFCVCKNEINLYLYQNNGDNNITKKEYIKKSYIIENSIKNKNSFYDCKITEITFFKNYQGIIGTILFLRDFEKMKNVESFDNLFSFKKGIVFDKNLIKNVGFILSPYLYSNNLKIIDPISNVMGRLPPIDNNNYNLNSIFSFHNYINNIFYLGGCNNFLPLFEIFYKFTLDENNTKEINLELKNIFNKLFKLLETVFSRKDKNCRIPIEKDVNFFYILQTFMEKIDEKYYYDNEELLIILINIGKKYNELVKSNLIQIQEILGFFINIIFSPDIIIKFNLDLQKKFFEKIKSFSVYMPVVKINKILILLSQKYKDDEIEKNEYSKTLFDYIKLIFENINAKDVDREKLFLLYINSKKILSNSLFIHIINLFIIYLDINICSFDLNPTQKNQRKKTVEYLINSENYFIENLLKYLSETNIQIKKVIINFLRVLTQIYGELLEQYFLKLNKKVKTGRINKEEFYIFIKENIAPNYNNKKTLKEKIYENYLNKKDSIFYLEKENESKNNNENKIKILFKEEKIKLDNKRASSFKINKKRILSELINNITDNMPKKRYKSFGEKSDKKIRQKEEPKQKEKNKLELSKSTSIEELSSEKKTEIRDTKSEVALILYNWFLSLINEIEEKRKNNEEIKEESINHVIEFIVKFISYTKELDVIFRILFLLSCQKFTYDDKKANNQNKYIYALILYYLSKNSLFLQVLIELLIDSYLYKNLYAKNAEIKEDNFIILFKNNEKDIKNLKLKNFTLIFEKSFEILMDIYFLEGNQNKVEILNKVFLISLKLLLVFQDQNKIDEKNLLLKFLKQFFSDVSRMYDNKHKTIKKFYLDFITFFVDYCFILNISEELKQNSYKTIIDDRTHCLPDFLTCQLIYENEDSYIWAGSDIYKQIFNNIKKLFCIKNIFVNLEIVYKDVNKGKEKQKNIFEYDINWIESLINEVIYKKKKEEPICNNTINALFYSFGDCGYNNNFPIINIISLFYSLHFYLLYTDTTTDIKEDQLILLLNEIQNYIIYLILLSYIINPKENYKINLSYEDIQILIYKNLFFIIQNIFNRTNDPDNKKYYFLVLHNTILFLTVINKIDEAETSKKKRKSFLKNIIFSSDIIDINKTASSMLIKFYKENYDNIFKENNFEIFIKGEKETNIKIIEDNISMKKIKEINNMKESPSFDLYNIDIFNDVVLKRYNEISANLRLLIVKENEVNSVINHYKKINLKVQKIKNNYFLDEIEQQQKEIFTIKSYRKIKKDLYSYNNSYSNLQVFYNMNLEQKQYLLKYKVCDFLSKDMSRKIIKPVIDINYYMPNFRKYDYNKKETFQHSNNEVYSIDLQIFKPISFLYPDNNINSFYRKKYYLEENVCYVKTSNHIKGVLFHSLLVENLSKSYLYFCYTEIPSEKMMIDTYDDYDSLNMSCYNSIFRNNLNKKDQDVYLKLNFDEINFIFNRKYSFTDNAIEIFTSNHRSYYFKFRTPEKRNQFVEHILSILNKDSTLFKKLFKPINSINEFGKKIILGYYKDIDNNSEYGNIYNIKELWKNNKISFFEYLMWINIYGNRSFRDISQYPVFPWIISNYKTETFKEIIDKKHIRNFKMPMGLLALNEKGKDRQEGYIESYKLMSLGLKEEKYIDFKIKDEDEEINEEQDEINNKDDTDKQYENLLQKIPKYNYNIEKIYKDPDIEYEKIPYLFGSHFSNAMYISHYMGRIFPYSLTMIEIQGSGFDCSERLFICLDKTFASATMEKCDVRELIPEFYFLPELFLNINKLNFGKINIDNYLGAITYYNELNEKNGKQNKIIIDDVLLPGWCKDNPYIYIIKSRELLENNNICNINPWIDLIFGYTQRGKPAQQVGNIFLSSSYDGVINNRIKDGEILKNRNESEFKMRLFELGVNPTKVFDKKLSDKKKILKQICDIKGNIDKKVNFIQDNNSRFVSNVNNNILLLFDKEKKIKKIMLEEKIEALSNNYKIKKIDEYEFLKPVFELDKYYKLFIKYLVKANIILLSGFYSGDIYLFSLEKNQTLKSNKVNQTIFSKMNNNDKQILNDFGKGFINSFEVSKDEKYIIYGNNKGTLIILELIYNNNTSENIEIKLLKIISSHSGYSINSISINIDLNLFADCSHDNYINIYTLPKCEKIISIYNRDEMFYLNYIFLSAQPLASVILYSNQTTKFKVFNINGHDLNINQNDINLLNESKNNKNLKMENMISPIIFTSYQFNDYLIYIFRNQYILLRKTPLMDLVFKINFNENEYISFINISLMKDYIYAIDNINKKVYIIHCDKCKMISNIEDQNESNNKENN